MYPDDVLMADSADWIPLRARVDPATFEGGEIGPYRLGHFLRATPWGEVRLALHDTIEEVVEIELYATLKRTEHAGPEAPLMADLAQVMALRHRHLATILGAGMTMGTPYVVRPHRLGRTLQDFVDRSATFSEAETVSLLFPIAEVMGYLALQGPQPGSCALPNPDLSELVVGFDGNLVLTNTGLGRLRRAEGDPLTGLLMFTELFEAASPSRILPLVGPAAGPADFATRLRRNYREVLAERAHHIGKLMRRYFGDELLAERTFFGMDTLH